MSVAHPARPEQQGLAYGLGAYLLWGLLPLFFRAMVGADGIEILIHRVLWSVIFLGIVISAMGRWRDIVSAVRQPKLLLLLTATAFLIAANWLIFIIAVQHGHVLEASLGYFINPLVNVALGMIFLKERLRPLQAAAVALAGAAVVALAVGEGAAPWVSLSLAFSFGFYGLLRKIGHVAALEGLTIETLLLLPFALGWIWLSPPGFASFAEVPRVTAVLFVLAGPVTAIPLLLFAAAAKRMPLSTLGLLQYIAPTMQFLCAVLLFGEEFRPIHAVAFGGIWCGLALYASDSLRATRSA